MIDYLPFIVFLMILAVFLRAESALTVFYMVLGAFILAYWWNLRSLRHVEVSRIFVNHAFIGDRVSAQLIIKNTSFLPILWLEIHEGVPVELRSGKGVKHVFSLSMRQKRTIQYDFLPLKRGFYTLGPLLISTGDPLGLIKPTQREYPAHPLIVYPQIVNLAALSLPSRSPFGTVKHPNPIFEDPSRIQGKREFQNGDSLHTIDWKSSAATGQLQVKLFEASISHQIAIVLDLHRESYDIKTFVKSTELAITTAASVAAWGKRQRQSVGLVTNGADPFKNDELPTPFQPKKGADHFIHILEILARIQAGGNRSVEHLIQDALIDLSWGATLVLITGSLQESTLKLLFQGKKRGIIPAIIITGQAPNYHELKNLAAYYKIILHRATYPQDLKTMGMT